MRPIKLSSCTPQPLPGRAPLAGGNMDAEGNAFMSNLFSTFKASMAEDAFTPPLIPEWIPFSNIIFPELQAAIVGDKTVKEALDAAAKETDYLMQDAGYY